MESPEEQFPAGKLLQGRITSVQNTSASHEDNKVLIELTLKHSASDDKQKELEQLEKGAVVVGTVKNVTDFGVFVAIKGTNLVGLCRKHAAVSGEENVYDVYAAGDIVQAKVLSVSNGKISLGLKSSCFKDDDDDAMSVDGSEEAESDEESDNESDEDSVDAMIAAAALCSDDEDAESAEEDAEDEVDDNEEGEDEEDNDDNEEEESENESEDMEYDSNDDGEEVAPPSVKVTKSAPAVKSVPLNKKTVPPVPTSADAADVVFDWEAPTVPDVDEVP